MSYEAWKRSCSESVAFLEDDARRLEARLTAANAKIADMQLTLAMARDGLNILRMDDNYPRLRTATDRVIQRIHAHLAGSILEFRQPS